MQMTLFFSMAWLQAADSIHVMPGARHARAASGQAGSLFK